MELEIDTHSCRRSDRASSQAVNICLVRIGDSEEEETTEEVEQMPITQCKQPNRDVTGEGGCDRKVRSR